MFSLDILIFLFINVISFTHSPKTKKDVPIKIIDSESDEEQNSDRNMQLNVQFSGETSKASIHDRPPTNAFAISASAMDPINEEDHNLETLIKEYVENPNYELIYHTIYDANTVILKYEMQKYMGPGEIEDLILILNHLESSYGLGSFPILYLYLLNRRFDPKQLQQVADDVSTDLIPGLPHILLEHDEKNEKTLEIEPVIRPDLDDAVDALKVLLSLNMPLHTQLLNTDIPPLLSTEFLRVLHPIYLNKVAIKFCEFSIDLKECNKIMKKFSKLINKARFKEAEGEITKQDIDRKYYRKAEIILYLMAYLHQKTDHIQLRHERQDINKKFLLRIEIIKNSQKSSEPDRRTLVASFHSEIVKTRDKPYNLRSRKGGLLRIKIFKNP